MSQYQSEGSHPQLYARNSPLTSTFEDHSTEYPSAHPEDYSEPPRITGSPAPSSNAFLLPRLDNRDLSERTLFHLATDGTVSAQAETSDPYADHSQQSPAVAGVVQCIHRECNMPYLLYINSTTQSGRQQAYGESSPAEWCTHQPPFDIRDGFLVVHPDAQILSATPEDVTRYLSSRIWNSQLSGDRHRLESVSATAPRTSARRRHQGRDRRVMPSNPSSAVVTSSSSNRDSPRRRRQSTFFEIAQSRQAGELGDESEQSATDTTPNVRTSVPLSPSPFSNDPSVGTSQAHRGHRHRRRDRQRHNLPQISHSPPPLPTEDPDVDAGRSATDGLSSDYTSLATVQSDSSDEVHPPVMAYGLAYGPDGNLYHEGRDMYLQEPLYYGQGDDADAWRATQYGYVQRDDPES